MYWEDIWEEGSVWVDQGRWGEVGGGGEVMLGAPNNLWLCDENMNVLGHTRPCCKHCADA